VDLRKDTKARDFDRKSKMEISRRDSIDGWPFCVYCGAAAPSELAWSNAHYISRAQGGLGIPANGLTLCPECHRRYDQTTAREKMRWFFREYLKEHYEEWSEEALIYRKERYG
jgi:5-methylcytosine-specific restriction endonuclease McrA